MEFKKKRCLDLEDSQEEEKLEIISNKFNNKHMLVTKDKTEIIHSKKKQKKEKKAKDSDSESDSDSEEDELVLSLQEFEERFGKVFGEKKNFSLLHKQADVYRQGNHIYFCDGVSMNSVSQLGKLLNEINKEYADLKHNVKVADLNPKPIYLHITSFGGSLLAGFRAIDMMQNSVCPVYTIVDGYAMSAGSLMSVCGVKRYMTRNSYILIHQLSTSASGTYENMKDDFFNDTVMMDRIVNIYKNNCNEKMTVKKIKDSLKRDLYWDFETCIENGLVDEVYSGQT